LARGIAQVPALLAAIPDFRVEVENLIGNFRALDQKRMKTPKTLLQDQEWVDERAPNVAIAHVGIFEDLIRVMNDNHVAILDRYRQRVLAVADNLQVPDYIAQTAVDAAQWERELFMLIHFDFTITETRAFYDVWKANNLNKQAALQSFVWFIVNPSHPRELSESEFFSLAVHLTYGRKTNEKLRKALLPLLIDTALRLAAADEGRFLAGVMHAIWMTKGQNLRKMWNRNLYNRSFKRGAIISWCQWFQEELLAKKDSDLVRKELLNVKEIVKSTLERATGISRDDPKKTWAATVISNALINYFH